MDRWMTTRNFHEGIRDISQQNKYDKLAFVDYLVFIFCTGDLHILNIRPQKSTLLSL